MRTLKFRIWNGMQMEYDITVGKFGTFYVNPENGDGLNPEDSASLTVNTTKYQDSIPVMQFTGLYDKNGKDIYEGDVLKIGNVFGYYHDVVKWNEKRASFWLDQKGYNLSHYISQHLLVIGNVHQNPELL